MARQLKRSLRFGASLLALLVGAFGPIGRALAQAVGSVGSVNPTATGTPPGGGQRTLSIGNSLVQNERLRTSAASSLQVAFSDRTTLNLGPNTDLVIDRYVFNPTTGAGSLQTTVSSGLMRFVGGQTSHNGEATVRTPVATIGIRGMMGIVEFVPGQGWRITSLSPGVLTVQNGVSSVQVRVPGQSVTVTGFNVPIPDPSRANPGAISQAFGQTLSRNGQKGGASRLPTNNDMARSGVGSTVPSSTGSTLGYVGTVGTAGTVGRNAASSRQPNRVAQPTTTPYGTR